MNRQKKLQQLFKAKAKKASAKLAPKSKDRYISKAEREKLAAEAAQESDVSPER
ncbi:DUF2986 domain-containing protein [Pseudomonas sp. G11]|jgi:hypothetical protein|uniref:DUF2986 domain-containing protein n=1 Tax=Pseudomonas TaxID=286 RepID=UPI00143D8B8B|nr:MULTISPECIES: DUF2986 domain-containing protein [Pseudomonas]WEX14011.1 DUF2986 domain-containing protein [Pseudomonas sp. G11]